MTTLFVILGIGTTEIIIIALIILILFGGRKIPELMRGLGRGVKEFKDGMNGVINDDDKKNSNTTQNSSSEQAKK